MGDLVEFPIKHRSQIVWEANAKRVAEEFNDAIKCFGLTYESINALPSLPRSAFDVTAAALIAAEDRGELPTPIRENGKLCYRIVDLVHYALCRQQFLHPLGFGNGRHVATCVELYRRHGEPRLI